MTKPLPPISDDLTARIRRLRWAKNKPYDINLKDAVKEARSDICAALDNLISYKPIDRHEVAVWASELASMDGGDRSFVRERFQAIMTTVQDFAKVSHE